MNSDSDYSVFARELTGKCRNRFFVHHRYSGREQLPDLFPVGAEREEGADQHLHARIRLLETCHTGLRGLDPPGEFLLRDASRASLLAHRLGEANTHLDDGNLVVAQTQQILNGSLDPALGELLSSHDRIPPAASCRVR